MIQVTSHMRIVVAVEPVDFRNGIDGLVRVCKEVLHADPFAGWLFVFPSRRGTAIKALYYDGQGFLSGAKALVNWAFSLLAREPVGGIHDSGGARTAGVIGRRQSGSSPRCSGMAARKYGGVSEKTSAENSCVPDLFLLPCGA